MYTLTYDVTGDLPEGYTAPAKQTLVKGSSYTVAAVPASVTGSKDGVNGTFSFNGWKKDDGTVLTGEQKLTADLTLHGVWTFTKKSSGGGGGGGGRKPTVTIPDEVPTGLNGNDHYAYIVGYPDKTVRPQNGITRAEAMALVNRVLKRLPETDEDLHADMIKWSDNSDASQWYYLDVQEATNSHYYQTKENQFEKWTELRDTRDWTELEK